MKAAGDSDSTTRLTDSASSLKRLRHFYSGDFRQHSAKLGLEEQRTDLALTRRQFQSGVRLKALQAQVTRIDDISPSIRLT
jgi:hypothetical protein